MAQRETTVGPGRDPRSPRGAVRKGGERVLLAGRYREGGAGSKREERSEDNRARQKGREDYHSRGGRGCRTGRGDPGWAHSGGRTLDPDEAREADRHRSVRRGGGWTGVRACYTQVRSRAVLDNRGRG